MSDPPSLRNTLKRGALVTAANWPVVAIQFVAESTFKLLLGVPVVGGALLVALALGQDLGDLLRGSPREVVAAVADALSEHPGALAGFLVALLVVVLGGSTLMFLIKGGTVTVLAEGAAAGGAIERPPLKLAAIRRAVVFTPERFIGGCRRLFRRYLRLGLVLIAVYAATGGAYVAFVLNAYRVAAANGLLVGWTLLAVLASSALIVWITVVNLVYLLTQMVLAVEDCGARDAFRRVMGFIRDHLRAVAQVFLVVLALVVLATVASVLATAGLSLISFVPLVGLAVFPLQAAAWLVRGLVFQFLGLTALGAYLSLYRPPDLAIAGETSPWVRSAS